MSETFVFLLKKVMEYFYVRVHVCADRGECPLGEKEKNQISG